MTDPGWMEALKNNVERPEKKILNQSVVDRTLAKRSTWGHYMPLSVSQQERWQETKGEKDGEWHATKDLVVHCRPLNHEANRAPPKSF